MVYKKYVKIDEKVHNSYSYESRKVGGKTVAEYLAGFRYKGFGFNKKKASAYFLFAFLVGVFLFGLFFVSFSLAEKAFVDIDSESLGADIFNRSLNLNLRHGELIPSDSKLIVFSGSDVKEYFLSDVLDADSVFGNFYIDGVGEFGSGEGFGVEGIFENYSGIPFEDGLNNSEKGFGEDYLSENVSVFSVDIENFFNISFLENFDIELVYGNVSLGFLSGEGSVLDIGLEEENGSVVLKENFTEVSNESVVDSVSVVQYGAILNERVKWKKVVKKSSQEIKVEVPKEAINVTVYRILNSSKEVFENKEEQKSSFSKFVGFKSFSGEPVEDNKEIIIDDQAENFEVEYVTPGPVAYEKNISNGKQIIISSDTHYENILAYTELPSPVSERMIRLYRIVNGAREKVDFVAYSDEEFLSNETVVASFGSSGEESSEDILRGIESKSSEEGFLKMVSHIEWIVPHLSNQTYELEFDILNLQSYPIVGGDWIVEFNTSGVADLSIGVGNGTSWSKDDDYFDLRFLDLKCGEESVDYSWVDNSIYVSNYSCEDTSYHVVKVLSEGAHYQFFQFGDSSGVAKNWASYNITEGVVGWWKFDDDEGVEMPDYGAVGSINMSGNVLLMHFNNESSAGESDSLAVDWSGFGNNGSVVGATWSSSGKIGDGAFEFDGSGDFVDVGLSESINTTGAKYWTFSLWTKTNTLDAVPRSILGNIETEPWHANPGGIRMHRWSSTFYFEIANGTGDTTTTLINGNVVDQWYHLVGTYNGTGIALYRDGVLVDSSVVVAGQELSDSSKNLRIGHDSNDAGIWNGSIDEVAIWNRSLSDDEIKNLYLIQEGAYPKDYSGNGNDGVVSGDVLFSQGNYKVGNGAYEFEGDEDYITGMNGNELNGDGVNYTVSAWFKTTTTDDAVILDKKESGSLDTYHLDINERCDNDGTVSFYYEAGNGIRDVCSTSNGFNDGNWHHVVGVRNSTNITLYVDGVFEGMGYSNPSEDASSAVPLDIGARRSDARVLADYFNGSIDEVMIWNKPLSASEVLELYDVGNESFSVSNLTIWDTGDSRNVYANYSKFYADWNIGAGDFNGTDYSCEFRYNKSGSWSLPEDMVYNGTSGFYELVADGGYLSGHKIGMPVGSYYWNVSCRDFSGMTQNISLVDEVSVGEYNTSLAVNSSEQNPVIGESVLFSADYSSDWFNVSGVGFSSDLIGQVIWNVNLGQVADSVAFFDYDHDYKKDEILFGVNDNLMAFDEDGVLLWISEFPGRYVWKIEVSDMDNDSYFDDIAIADDGGYLRTFDHNGVSLFNSSDIGYVRDIAISDIDGDGLFNDFFVREAGNVYAYNSTDGSSWDVAWTMPLVGHDQEIKTSDDIDGDGIRDVIVNTYTGPYLSVYSGRNGTVLFNTTTFIPRISSVGAADLDHDGVRDEIVASTWNTGYIFQWNGIYDTTYDDVSDTLFSFTTPYRSLDTVVTDLDFDGWYDDIVMAGNDWVRIYDNDTQVGSYYDDGLNTVNTIIVDDINNDGENEVILAGDDDEVYVFNRTAGLLWSYVLDEGDIGYLYSHQAALGTGDVNGDGILDIGVASEGGHGHILQQASCSIQYSDEVSTFYDESGSELNDGLVLLMHMDNDSAYGESDSVVYDFSLNGNDGVVTNANVSSMGKFDGAFEFDGVGDYIVANNPSGYYFEDFTYSVWFKPSSFSGYKTLIDLDTDEQYVGFNGGSYVIYGRCGYKTLGTSDTNWHHLVWVVSGANYTVYEDGVEIASGDGCSSSISGDDITIGAYSTGAGEYFNGTIDEVGIWNRSLSEKEVYESYMAGAPKYSMTWSASSDQWEHNRTFAVDNTDNVSSSVVCDKAGYEVSFISEVSVQADANSIPDVDVFPSIPVSSEDLYCNVTSVSGDFAPSISIDYSWYKNGVLNLSGSFNVSGDNVSAVLLSGNVSEDEIWICGAEISDGVYDYYVNSSSVLIRSEVSIDRAIINWRDSNDYLAWGKLFDKRVVRSGFIEEADMGSYFGRAPMVFNENGSEAHVILRDGGNDIHIREFNWTDWTEIIDQGAAGTNRGSMSIDRYGDTLIAVWGDNDGDVEPPVYAISTDGGTTWTSEEFINSTYNKFGNGNTMEFKFLDDGNGIAIWKSDNSGIGWAYAYWNGTGWEHMGLVNDSNTGSVGRADLAILPGAGALLNFQNSDNMVYSWNGTGFDSPVNVDGNSNTDSHNGPAIDCNRFGECISVWTDSSNYLEYRRYNGTDWVGAEDMDIDGIGTWGDSHAQEPVDLEIDDNGDAVLIWYEDTETEVYYATYNWSTDSWTQGSDFISYVPGSSIEYGDSPQVRLVPLSYPMVVGPMNITTYLDNETYFTAENISGYCSAEDMDSPALNYTYYWYLDDVLYDSGIVNGASEGSLVLLDVIDSSETDRGETWKFSCSVSDGIESISSNNESIYIAAPIVAVNFVNSFPMPTDDLVCNFSVVSLENPDNLTAYYRFYKEGVLDSSGSMDVNDSEIYNISFDNENTRTDDVWTCSVVVSNVLVNGSWDNSSVYVRMKTSIDEAFVTWNDASYRTVWTEIIDGNFTNATISVGLTISGGGSNLVRFVLNPALSVGRLIYNAATDNDIYMYEWGGSSWGSAAEIGTTIDNDDTYDIARYGKTIIVIWGSADSTVPLYRISRDDGVTWSSQAYIESSDYGKFSYHSGLDFEFLTDGTGILLYKDVGGLGWIYSIWDGNSFVESGRLDDTDGGGNAKASIAALPDGEAFVVRRGAVYLNRWNGTAFSARSTIDSSSTGYPGGPEVACNIYGNCMVAHRDGDAEIEYLRYNGSDWSAQDIDIDGSDTWSDTYYHAVLDLAMDDDNNSIVVWYSEDRTEVRFATYNWSADNWTYKGVLGSANIGLIYGDGVQVELRMPFDEPPSLVNMTEAISYVLIDPMDNLTIEAYVYDAENNFNLATLEWKNQSGDWNSESVWNVSAYGFTTRVQSIFVPTEEGIYTYRLRMYDSEGNMDVSNEQNVTVSWECSWSVSDSLGSLAGWDERKHVGNITLSNLGDVEYTGDCSLDFRISYSLDEGRVYYDDEYLKNSVLYNLNEDESMNVTIDAEFLSETKEESLYVLFDEVRGRSDNRYYNTSATLISNQAGPYIYGEITTSPSSVYLTGDNFNLNGYIRNVMGSDSSNVNDTAYNVTFYWDFPTGVSAVNSSIEFENISDSNPVSLSVSAGFDNLASMSPGASNFSLIAVGYNVSGDLIEDSLGVQRFERTADVSFVCYDEADSVCVVECGYVQDPDCSAPVTIVAETSSGGGGGGGGGSSGPIIEERSESYELVIGESSVFEFVVENDLDVAKEGVKISVEGAGSSEIDLSPSFISQIPANSESVIMVDLSSKSYQLQETLNLIFTISGYITEGEVVKSFTQRVSVELRLLEISRDEAARLFNLSSDILDDMDSLNLTNRDIEDQIKLINESYESVDFLSLKESVENLEDVYHAAKSSKSLIEELEENMELSEAMGIDILESKKMYLVAMKAYQRGDFEVALEKLNEARLTYVLETKGKFNLIGYVLYRPYRSSLYFALLCLAAFSLVILVKILYYKRKIKVSKKNQDAYLEIMKVSQRDCFEKKKMSMGEYNTAISEYRNKLSDSVKMQIKYEERLLGVSKIGGTKKVLIKERDRMLDLVKDVQHDYLVKGRVDSRIYELILKNYMERLAEIEEKIVQIEAKKAMRSKRKFADKVKNEK